MGEIRVTDEQGKVHVFPAGSTPEMIAQAMGVKPPGGVASRTAVSPAGAPEDPNFTWHRGESNPEIDAAVQKAIASTKPAFLSYQPKAVDLLPTLEGFDQGGISPVGPTRQLPNLRAGDVAAALGNTLTDVAPGTESGTPPVGTEAVEGVRNLGIPGQRVRGAAQLIGAVGEGLSPVVGPAILESPISVGAGLAAGMGTSEGAGRVTKALGGSPDAEELARQAGFWLPSLAGSALPWLRGKGRPTESVTEIPSSPEGTSAVTAAPEVQDVAPTTPAPLEAQQAPVEATAAEPNPEVMQAKNPVPGLPWLRGKVSQTESSVEQQPTEETSSPSEGVHVPANVLERSPSAEQMKVAFPDPGGELSPGELERGILRENRGQEDRAKEQTYHELSDAISAWNKRPAKQSLNFIDAIETGGTDTLPPGDRELAGQLRTILDNRRDTIRNLRPGALEHYRENYFPHSWEKPSAARAMVMGVLGEGRSARGPASFLKQRTFDTVRQGVEAGLKPVTYNPVELMLIKLHEMDRYIGAYKSLDMMKREGLATFVKTGQRAPDGWAKLEDKIGTAYGRSKEGELVIRGNYFAPGEAAAVFNRNLSPGLTGRSRAYDIVRGASNTLNSAQLGISAYHLGFTSLDSMISDVALGLQKVSRGKVSGVGDVARGMLPISPVLNYLRGSKVLKEYLDPGSYAKFQQQADWVARSGGRAFLDPVYRNNAMRAVRTAFKDGRFATGAARLPGALVEALAKPIMEHIVPRQKLGVFSKMASEILDQASHQGWSNAKVRLEMNRAWDSVDNRMGQLVYDNLFAHRTLKDIAMISTRSLGWNLGSFREILGGVKDAAGEAGKAFKGQRPDMTSRMAYTLALPAVTATYGALIGYLAGNKPKELKDYFFPIVDDAGNRVSLPSYMKDIFSWSHDPLAALGHKTNPLISQMVEMLQNRDFFGTEIRNADDPIVQQVMDAGKYMGKQYLPFSVRNMAEQQKRGSGLKSQTATFFGVTPAPSYINNSDAVNRAIEYGRANRGEGTRTRGQAEQSERRRQLADQIRTGTKVDLAGEIKAGRITRRDAQLVQQSAKESKLIRASKSLPIEQLLKVSEVANPDELKELRPILMRRLGNLGRSHDPEQAAELAVRIRNVLAARTAPQQPGIPNALRKVLGTRVGAHTQGVR
jgi:hypothetical protein